MVASESAALSALGYSFERDVKPGEAIIISESGELLKKQCYKKSDHTPCLIM
jgi:amidophosphoribosyltransferase